MRDIIFVLATQGWPKLIDENDDLLHTVVDEEPIDGTDGHAEMESNQNRDKFSAIDRIVGHFKFPLEASGVDVFAMKAKFEAILSYAGSFISLSTLIDEVWGWLFHYSSEWSNILALAKLQFSLPQMER